jgi:tetratricopeptide (TPR) repeat protein
VQYSTDELAPAAQWWVAEHHFRQGDFPAAEKNYKQLFQTWPLSPLAYEARMMAGRAVLGWADNAASYSIAIGYFTNLTSDLNCPAALKVQALFAYGDTLMQQESGDTNKFANVEEAIRVFSTILQLNPTNGPAPLAWGEIAKCYLQLASSDPRFYDAATNAFRQVLNTNLHANVSVRSQAQIGIGIALEKKAALAGSEQTALLTQALDNYLDVFYRKNEQSDAFWRKKAGMQALPLVEMLGVADPNRFIDRMQELFPPLKASLEKKRTALSAARN